MAGSVWASLQPCIRSKPHRLGSKKKPVPWLGSHTHRANFVKIQKQHQSRVGPTQQGMAQLGLCCLAVQSMQTNTKARYAPCPLVSVWHLLGVRFNRGQASQMQRQRRLGATIAALVQWPRPRSIRSCPALWHLLQASRAPLHAWYPANPALLALREG